jgi:hypothetical protein
MTTRIRIAARDDACRAIPVALGGILRQPPPLYREAQLPPARPKASRTARWRTFPYWCGSEPGRVLDFPCSSCEETSRSAAQAISMTYVRVGQPHDNP